MFTTVYTVRRLGDFHVLKYDGQKKYEGKNIILQGFKKRCFKTRSLQTLTKPGSAQVGAPLKFLEYAKDTVFKLLSLSQCREIPKKDTQIFFGNVS